MEKEQSDTVTEREMKTSATENDREWLKSIVHIQQVNDWCTVLCKY